MKGETDEAIEAYKESKRQLRSEERAEMKQLTSGAKGGPAKEKEKKVSAGKAFGARAKKKDGEEVALTTDVAADGGSADTGAAPDITAEIAPAAAVTDGVAALRVEGGAGPGGADGGAGAVAAPAEGGVEGNAMEEDDADGATLLQDDYEQVLGMLCAA